MMETTGKIPDKNPFRVPENYFEEVNKRIIAATAGEGRKKTPVLRLRSALIAAASLIGFVLLTYTAVKLITPYGKDKPENEAANEDYFYSLINEIDTYSLEEDAAILFQQDERYVVSQSDIIDYLVFENIDITEIYEQL